VSTVLQTAAGQNRDVTFMTGSMCRWQLRVNFAAEIGADAGSDLELISRADNGSFKRTSLAINRATGAIKLSGRQPVVGATSVSGSISASGPIVASGEP